MNATYTLTEEEWNAYKDYEQKVSESVNKFIIVGMTALLIGFGIGYVSGVLG